MEKSFKNETQTKISINDMAHLAKKEGHSFIAIEIGARSVVIWLGDTLESLRRTDIGYGQEIGKTDLAVENGTIQSLGTGYTTFKCLLTEQGGFFFDALDEAVKAAAKYKEIVRVAKESQLLITMVKGCSP